MSRRKGLPQNSILQKQCLWPSPETTTTQEHQLLQVGMSRSAENCLSAFIYAPKDLANWLWVGCSIFKCIHLASSTALINTDSAENTGGCGDVGPVELFM